MILKQVHNNKIGAYAFMLLILLVLWVIPALKSNVEPITVNYKMPLWDVLLPVVKLKWVSLLFSFLCALFAVLGITRFNTRYSLLQSQSALPGFIFVLLTGSISSVQFINPVWIATIFVIISFGYLYEAYNHRKTMVECFLASLWIAVGSLFSYKIVLLYPLLLLFVMPLLRVLTFRSFLASIIGFILPWLFILGYELALGSIDEFLSYLQPTQEKLLCTYSFTQTSLIYFGILLLLLLSSVFKALNELSKRKIFTRKQYNTIIISSVYIVFLIVLTGGCKEFLPVLSVFVSLLLAHLIDRISSWVWQNIFFFSIVAITVFGQLFL